MSIDEKIAVMEKVLGRPLTDAEKRIALAYARPFVEADFVTRIMAKYGWDALWYALPFPPGIEIRPGMTMGDVWEYEFGPQDKPPLGLDEVWDRDAQRHYGPRWFAGVWTGPDNDLVCLKPCSTSDEAQRWLSPGGWSPEDAVRAAVERIEILRAGDA